MPKRTQVDVMNEYYKAMKALSRVKAEIDAHATFSNNTKGFEDQVYRGLQGIRENLSSIGQMIMRDRMHMTKSKYNRVKR